jgi:hypothetical protein
MITARNEGEAQRWVFCFAEKINVGKSEPWPFNIEAKFSFI